jgi:hypothetical protein
MPPKQRTPASGAPQTTTSTPARSTKSTGTDAQDILQGIYNKYVQKTPQRVKLLDTFMAFLVVVGALQFLYVVLVGNFVRTPALYTLQSSEEVRQGTPMCGTVLSSAFAFSMLSDQATELGVQNTCRSSQMLAHGQFIVAGIMINLEDAARNNC